MSQSQGISAELIFRNECIKRNITPSVPDIDNGNGFDVITSYENKLQKIQIKSTNTRKGNGWRVICSHGSKNKKRYTKNHCDIVAVYITELDLWYLIKIEEINSVSLTLFPDRLDHKHSKNNSAWHLLAS